MVSSSPTEADLPDSRIATPSALAKRIADVVTRWFLALLLWTYGLAVLLPSPGVWISQFHWEAATTASLSQVWLATLLLLAGLGIDLGHFQHSLT